MLEQLDPFWVWVVAICVFLWVTNNRFVVAVIALVLAVCLTTDDGKKALCKAPWQPRSLTCPAKPPAIDPSSPSRTLGYVVQELKRAT